MGIFGHLESMTTENGLKEAGLLVPTREAASGRWEAFSIM